MKVCDCVVQFWPLRAGHLSQVLQGTLREGMNKTLVHTCRQCQSVLGVILPSFSGFFFFFFNFASKPFLFLLYAILIPVAKGPNPRLLQSAGFFCASMHVAGMGSLCLAAKPKKEGKEAGFGTSGEWQRWRPAAAPGPVPMAAVLCEGAAGRAGPCSLFSPGCACSIS